MNNQIAIPSYRQQMDAYPEDLYIVSLSETARIPQQVALKKIAFHVFNAEVHNVAWEQLDAKHIIVIRAWLLEAYAPTTARRMMYAVLGTIKRAWLMEDLGVTDARMAKIREAAAGMSSAALRGGQLVPRYLMHKMLERCSNDDFMDTRDKAMLSYGYAGCMRSVEVRRLNYQDLVEEGVRVQRTKGEPRVVKWVDGMRAWTDAYLVHRGTDNGVLFQDVQNRSRLSRQGYMHIIKQLGKRVGLPDLKTHDLRKSGITNLFQQGVDVISIAHHSGHSNIKSLMVYDLRSDQERQEKLDDAFAFLSK